MNNLAQQLLFEDKGGKNASKRIMDVSKRIFKAIMKRINNAFNYIKQLGKKMLQEFMQFFGIEVKNIKINGGGAYPLL